MSVPIQAHVESPLTARDARHEAQDVVGDDLTARVLEPSPPAVDDGEWFADDPVAAGRPVGGSGVPGVSPVPNAELTWDEWLHDHPEHDAWVAARWLGAYRRLPPLPETLTETRLALHRLAVYVVSPARRRANGKIALRWTLGGFGTPFFGADEQVRVVGTHLVRQRGDRASVQPVTTLAAAAALVLDGEPDIAWAEPFDVPAAGALDAKLAVDETAADFLGEWYGFAYSVMEELRADAVSTASSRVQLWPEHFDAAFDCLDQERRATFGASPGDAATPEPYLYVVPANAEAAPADELWNAESFRGAILPMRELAAAADQRAHALRFFRSVRDALRDA